MRGNRDIEELLNGFIDGELTAEQQAEVERLIDRDEGVGQHLRRLQKCKILMGSLPFREAPASVLEGIKASLGGTALAGGHQVTSDIQAQTRRLPVRRLLSAAAVIGLAAVLTAVTYTFVAPETSPEGRVVGVDLQPGMAGASRLGPEVAAAPRFSGRLELKTSALAAVDAFVNSAIEDNGLSAPMIPLRRQDRRIYSLTCSREALDLLLADMEVIWAELDTATLFVDTGVFGKAAVVEAVTTEQIGDIVDQDSTEKRIRMAQDFSALNSIAQHLPGKEIMAAIGDGSASQITIPKPLLTSGRETVTKSVRQDEGKETVRLTIVIGW